MLLRRPLSLFALGLFLGGCDSLPKRGNDAATVSIGQPTVYMRERSLIERFEDLEWLRLQRSPEKEKEYDQGFQGSVRTATAEATGFALKAAIGEVLAEEEANPPQPLPLDGEPPTPAPATDGSGDGAATDPAPAEDGDVAEPAESSGASNLDVFAKLDELDSEKLGNAFNDLNKSVPSVSPRDKLVNRIAFRDTAAEAIRQRSLDDVHDLEGNALYEVQFDLSLVGGEDPGSAYAVMLDIAREEAPKAACLSPGTRNRIVESLKSACLAEIEETTARYREGWLTNHDAPYMLEAEWRGVTAARHAELQTLRRKVEAAEAAQRVVHRKILERIDELKDASAFKKIELPTNPSATEDCGIGGEEYRDVIVSGDPTEVTKRAQELVCNLRALCKRLRELAEREAVLRVHRRELEARDKAKEAARERAEEPLSPEKRVDKAESAIRALVGKVDEKEGQVQIQELRESLGATSGDSPEERLNRLTELSQRLPDPLKAQVVEEIQAARESTVWPEARDDSQVFHLSAPSSLSSDSATVRNAAEQERLHALLQELDRRELDVPNAEELVELMQSPADATVRKYTRRALGFVIARYHAENSGGVLGYSSVAVHGLDARALLGRLLVEQPACHWDLPLGSEAKVVSVTPSEVAEQTTTSAHSDLRMAFSVALEGLFRGTVASANSTFDRVSQELRRYELIGRNPLLVGFVGGDVRPGSPSNSFGWIVSPRLETSTSGKATLRYRQASSHHSVSATLIAPALLTELHLHYRVFRIDDSGEWLECRSVPQPLELVRKAPFPAGATPAPRERLENRITLQLPSSPELVAQGVMAANRSADGQPKVLAARPSKRLDEAAEDGKERRALWRLQADEKAAIAILGRNLWRNPQVYVGGQRAMRVQIMSDLGGLWAEFDRVQAPAGHEGKPVPVDLVVSTSRGTDRILEGVLVMPPKDAKPPEPKFGPPVQAVVPTITQEGAGATLTHKASFALRFELTPPLPKVWTELRLRARPQGAVAYAFDVPVSSSQVVLDPKKPGNFEIRDVALTKAATWDAVEVFEVMLQVREANAGDLRSVHTSPIEVVLVAQPMVCTPGVGTVLAEKLNDRWLLAEEDVVKLTPIVPLQPLHAERLLPELKPGVWVGALLKVGTLDPRSSVVISAKEGEVGRTWMLKLPKGMLVATGANLPAGAVPFEVEIGKVKWSWSQQLQAKP